MLESAERVLLVELINADQFPGQICRSYPLIKGHLSWTGRQSRWLRFALPSAHLYRRGSDAAELDDAELERLLRVAAELAPDLVLLTHRLDEPQFDALRMAASGARFYSAGEGQPFETLAAGARDPETAFCGVGVLGRPGYVPEYDWEPGNAAAERRDRNNIYVLLARRCGYLKSVTSNPLYADVDLPGRMDSGCAFCCARGVEVEEGERVAAAHGRPWVAHHSTPPEWVVTQIRALSASAGPARRPNALLFEELENPEILRAAIETMREVGLAEETRLLFGIRADQLLRIAPWLEQALARPGDAPAVQVFSCGLESFVDEELLRLNKGTTSLDNLRAVNLLKELELRYPGRFYYSGYMGLSVIFFTPWTTIPGLHRNARLLQHLRLENEVGNVFQSRLRLHPDLAITRLARRDGLLIEGEGDAALRLNRRKLFREELPWRHREPRLGPITRVATRLDPDDSLHDDPIFRRVQELFIERRQGRFEVDSGQRRRAALDVLASLVETALAEPHALAAEDLMLGAAGRMNGRRAARRSIRIGEEPVSMTAALRRLTPLLRRGNPRAVSLPVHSQPEVSRLDVDGLATTLVGRTLLAGASWDDVNRAAELTRQIERSQSAEAVSELARLCGAPDCCAGARAEAERAHVSLLRWSLLASRGQTPGPSRTEAAALLAGPLGFVPCRPACERAEETLAAWLTRLGVELPPHAALLFELDGDELVVLPSASTTERTLRYDADRLAAGEGRLRDALRGGKELRMEPAQVQLWNGEEPTAIWTASVGVISEARSWHGEHWQELWRAATRNADPLAVAAAARVAAIAGDVIADPTIGH